MTNYRASILVFALLATFLISDPAKSFKSSQRILIVHSYHQGFCWTDTIMAGMLDVLQREAPDADVHVEYLDAKRLPPENLSHLFDEILKLKFSGTKPNVILVSDDAAFDLMLNLRDKHFPGIPLVFCGVNDFKDERLAGHMAVTGVTEEFDIKGTVEIALKLHPNAKHMAVISDSTETGAFNRQRFLQAAPEFSGRLGIIELFGLSTEELSSQLKSLPRDSFILNLSFFRDRLGQSYSTSEGNRMLASLSGLPIYSCWDFYLVGDMVGGLVVSGRQQGEASASMAAQVLNGVRIEDVHILRKSPNIYMFDHDVLERFGIKKSALPKGSILLNHPVTILEQYGAWLFGVALFCGLQMVLIFSLLHHRRLSRKATASLAENESKYRLLVEQQTDMVIKVDTTGRFLYVSPSYCRVFGKREDELLDKTFIHLVHEEDRPETEAAIRSLFSPPHTAYMEQRALTADGWRWLAWKDSAILGPDGQVKEIIGVGRDISERKHAEDALRESEIHFRTLFENAPLPYQSLNEQGYLLDVNKRWLETLGYDREEVIGKWFGNFLGPGVTDHFDKNFPMFKQACIIDGVEFDMVAKSGQIICTAFNGRVQLDRDGEFLRTHCIFTDITEHKQAEEAIRLERTILRDILESTLAGYWDWNLQDNKEYLSPMFKRMLGYEEHELENNPETWQQLIHPDDLPKVFDVFHRHVESRAQVPFYNEVRYRHKDGSWVWVICGGRVFEWAEDGKPLRMVGCHVDITTRKQAEQELRKALKDNQTFFEAVAQPAIVLSKNYEILMANAAAAAVVGKKVDELIGTKCHSIFHCTKCPSKGCPVAELLQGGLTGPVQMEMSAANGTFLVAVTPVYDESDEIERIIHIATDITQLKDTEEALIIAKDLAEAANRAKSEFLANMSHEIRTPLNGLLGMLQLIKTSEKLDEVEMYAEMGMRAGQRLTSLLGDILDLSRIEAGRMPIANKPFVLANIFTALAETFSPMNFSKSLPLIIDASPDIPIDVVGDEVRVRQVLFNLVGNAMKFTDHGEVRVEVSTILPHPSGTARLLFIVSDTGLGIPDEKIGQICAPFTQVSEDFTRSHQGAGLGLAIAVKLVEALGGTLAFDSIEGQGTSVYLTLPFSIPEQSAIPLMSRKDASAESFASLHLLLVEDDEICRFSARSTLEKMGHQVVTANNGAEALEALRESSFDCVLMDVQMDILDGVEATRRIRGGDSGALYTQVPIIAMTAYAMAGDRERFIEAGMDDYIAKPVHVDELKKVLMQVTKNIMTT